MHTDNHLPLKEVTYQINTELTCNIIQLVDVESQREEAFNTIKDLVTKHPVLTYYDVKEEVTVQCDVSDFGQEASLMQEGQPVAYASEMSRIHIIQLTSVLLTHDNNLGLGPSCHILHIILDSEVTCE